MKVGLIYTSTTPELIELVEKEVKGQLGEDVELYSIEDPSILAETRDAGYVTPKAAARLIGMYMKAVGEDCEASSTPGKEDRRSGNSGDNTGANQKHDPPYEP